jgi:hypothetical protein
MEPRPFYFRPGKKISNSQFFRNYWCSGYDQCLYQAAREDLYLDCTGCLNKDSVEEIFLPFLKHTRTE